MTVGQKIKELRHKKSITQKGLAERLNVSFQTVSKWENDENEPDVSTLKELAKIFGCSVDELLGLETPKAEEPAPIKQPIEEKPAKSMPEQTEVEETATNAQEQPTAQAVSNQNASSVAPVIIISDSEKTAEAKTEVATESKTAIINQKELHVCERCKKDIPEDQLEMEEICVRHRHRGRAPIYRQAYYHKDCLKQKRAEEEKADQKKREIDIHDAKAKCFGWSGGLGALSLIASLLIMLLVPSVKAVIEPGFAVLYSVLIGYGMFAALYCILSGSYIAHVFVWCATRSIKFPALIFSWSWDGLKWLIGMKILFAILGFLFGIATLVFAIGFSVVLGAISFPFVLIHDIRTDYENTLVGD